MEMVCQTSYMIPGCCTSVTQSGPTIAVASRDWLIGTVREWSVAECREGVVPENRQTLT